MKERLEIGGFFIEPQVIDERMHIAIGNIAGDWRMTLRDDNVNAAILANAIANSDEEMKNYLHIWLIMVWSMFSTFPDVPMLEQFNEMIGGRVKRMEAEQPPKEELTEEELAEDLAVERMRINTEEKAEKIAKEVEEELKRNKKNDDNA